MIKHVSMLTQAGREQGNRAEFNILPLLTITGQAPNPTLLPQAKHYVLSFFFLSKTSVMRVF